MNTAEENLPGTERQPPPGWGGEPFSQFLATGWRNVVDTYIEDPSRWQPLADVDGVYRSLIQNLADNTERLAGTFVVQSHASLLAAGMLAMSGQVAESYRLVRSSLRCAMQALYVAGDSDRQKVWAARNDDEPARAKMRTEFQRGRLLEHLQKADATTAKIATTLYERALEHETHPNTYATVSRAKGSAEADRFDFTREYFVTGDEVQRYALRTATQAGICNLSILFYVFPARYRSLGLDERLTKLRQGH